MKKVLAAILVVGLALMFSRTVGAKTEHGSAADLNNPELGEIRYVGNPSGYHFWFSPSADLAWYTGGHAYHNIYKFEVKDPSDWCPTQALVPDREPYNQVAKLGTMVWYKIYDITAGEYVCGRD